MTDTPTPDEAAEPTTPTAATPEETTPEATTPAAEAAETAEVVATPSEAVASPAADAAAPAPEAVEPTAVQPTAVQPTAVQPTAEVPASAETPVTPAASAAQTPAAPASAAPASAAQPPAAPAATAAPAAQPAPAVHQASTGPTQPVGAFGQPAPQAQPGYYGTQPAPTHAPTESTQKSSRRGTLPLVAAVIAGALVGGLSSAGVAALVSGQNSNGTTTSSVAPQNVVVNDTSSVNEITAVAAKASPSVVTISTQGQQGAGTGSGVVLSADGYVLTNTHVVTLDGSESDTTLQVRTEDGKLYDATVVGTDPIADLAVIKLKNASGLTPLEFADSSKLNVGDAAVAIGAPLGLSGTVTNGIVSALNRSIQVASSAVPDQAQGDGAQQDPNSGSPFDFWNSPGQENQQSSATTAISLPVIQTDAAINPGNSGGALLNSKGELIGINVAIASASDTGQSQSGSIGVGFAIPSNLAKRVADEIIKDGKATHGLLGASVTDADSTDAGVVGALVKEVVPGGAADKAGLKAGDIITVFDGVQIGDAKDLTAQVRYLAGGATSDLSYVRGGDSTSTSVTLGTLGS